MGAEDKFPVRPPSASGLDLLGTQAEIPQICGLPLQDVRTKKTSLSYLLPPSSSTRPRACVVTFNLIS